MSDQTAAIEWLRQCLKPGANVYTLVRHVTKSGMSRSISLFIVKGGEIVCVDWYASKAMGRKRDDKHGGLKIKGCGMDMSFALVYDLGRTLFPDGFKVDGVGRNGDTSGWDNDGGYALKRIHM